MSITLVFAIVSILVACMCFCGAPLAHAEESANADAQGQVNTDQALESTETEADDKGGTGPVVEPEDEPQIEPAKTVEEVQAAQAKAIKTATKEAQLDSVAALGKLADGSYADGLENGATYLVKLAKTNDKVLAVEGSSKKAGANVATKSSDMGQDQQWKVVRDAKGYVSFLNALSGKALAVAGKAKSGVNVAQVKYSKSSRAQKWLVVVDGGSWKIASALGRGLVLSIAKASGKAGANVCVDASASAGARRLDFIRVDYDYANPQKKIVDIDASTWYELKTGRVLLGVDSSSDDGNVELQKSDGSLAQLFSFSFVKTAGSLGFYRIISAATGKFLTVSNGNLVLDANIVVGKKASGLSQLWVVEKGGKGTFSFVSAASGYALGAAAAKAGSDVRTSASPRMFSLEQRENLLADGIYAIRAAAKTSQVLDVVKASTKAGAACQLWGYGAAFNQKWNIAAVEGLANTYTIECVNSGKVLTASSDTKNAPIVQRAAGGSELQYWVPTVLSNGTIVFCSAGNSELSMGYAKGKTKNGTKIVLAEGDGSSQRFRIESVALLTKGFFFIRSAANPKLFVEVKNSSKNNGGNVDARAKMPKGHQGNQKWNVVVNPNGTIRLYNCLSEKVLAVKGGKAAAKANVIQTKKASSKAQLWKVAYVPGTGSFNIVSALDNTYVLELSSTSEGSNVRIGAQSDRAQQRFTFVATTYDPLTPEQRRMANRAQGFSSRTNYLIMVDTYGCRTGVFKGSKGNWKLVRYEACTTGAPGSDTIRGTYTINYHQDSLSKYPEAVHCTHIVGEYFFHSILYSTSELGHRESHGCVRLNWPFASYMQTLPYGSTVNLY